MLDYARDEERRFAPRFAATILATRKLAEIGDKPCPARTFAISDAVSKAELICKKLIGGIRHRQAGDSMVVSMRVARRITTFLLASFLWLHALFFWNTQWFLIADLSRYMHLTLAEVTLFVLLFIFSILCSSGWWNGLKSALYIYFFPFVLLTYAFAVLFRMLRAVNAWFNSDQPPDERLTLEQLIVVPTPAKPQQAITASSTKETPKPTSVLSIITRPFRNFTALWCALLLFATHKPVLWLSLAVVLCNLALRIMTILKWTVFSRSWLEKFGGVIHARLNALITGLSAVTSETPVSSELRLLWQQLGLWQGVARFLKNKYLLSRWATLVVSVFYAWVYIYIALLFSFVYLGIAKVSGLNLSWSEAVVNSIFVPIYVTDLPKSLFMRLAGGAQWTLVVVVGFGTFWNYFYKRLEAIHTGAIHISAALADEEVRTRYNLLESKLNPVSDQPVLQNQIANVHPK